MENQEKNHKRYCRKSTINCAVFHPDGICPDAQKCEGCELEDKQSNPLYRQGYEAGREKGQEEGAKGKFFSSVEITEPLPKDIYDKIFQAGREAERKRIIEELLDCQAEHNEARHGSTPDDAYDRVIDYLSALNAPEGE